MALCIVKVVALVVIAASLWNVSSSKFGYATNFGTQPQVWDGTGSWGSGAGLYNVENSQAMLQQGHFGNRYEPPVFWNIGDVETTDAFQHQKENLGIISYDDKADSMAPVAAAKGYNQGVKVNRGYNQGVKVNRGYATNTITPY